MAECHWECPESPELYSLVAAGTVFTVFQVHKEMCVVNLSSSDSRGEKRPFPPTEKAYKPEYVGSYY